MKHRTVTKSKYDSLYLLSPCSRTSLSDTRASGEIDPMTVGQKDSCIMESRNALYGQCSNYTFPEAFTFSIRIPDGDNDVGTQSADCKVSLVKGLG